MSISQLHMLMMKATLGSSDTVEAAIIASNAACYAAVIQAGCTVLAGWFAIGEYLAYSGAIKAAEQPDLAETGKHRPM